MHFSRLSSLLFLIPVCVVAQTTQRPGYVCFTPQPQAPQPLPLGNTPFPHPVLFQRPSFPQDRINLAHIIPPQEFHVPTLTMVDAEKVSLLLPHLQRRECVYVDEKGRFH
jgi:hypothetical protein